MFERITVNQRQGETQNDRSETRISRDSIEVQIGVLKEVAVSLLQQIETLKRGTVSQTSDNGKSLHDEVREEEPALAPASASKVWEQEPVLAPASSQELISGPPPWTSTGRRPTPRRHAWPPPSCS